MLETVESKALVNESAAPTSGEDMLLVQIDAFREKAKQLQMLTAAKERRVKELENIVRVNEERNAELLKELETKQAEADSIATSVENQVDRMLQALQDTLSKQMAANQAQAAEQIEANQAHASALIVANQAQAAEQIKSLEETLRVVGDGLDIIKNDLSDKVHNENVKQYRNIQDLLKELDHSALDRQLTSDRFDKLDKATKKLRVFAFFNFLFALGAAAASITIVLIHFGII